jgi:hypothetical protein
VTIRLLYTIPTLHLDYEATGLKAWRHCSDTAASRKATKREGRIGIYSRLIRQTHLRFVTRVRLCNSTILVTCMVSTVMHLVCTYEISASKQQNINLESERKMNCASVI